MFKFRYGAAVSAMLLMAGTSFSQTPGGWPFAGFDLNDSHWASAETILNNQNVGGLTVKWKFTTQDDVSAIPSVDATGGYVYFPDWSGNLYKLNAATGAVAWKHSMTDYGFGSGVMSRTTPTLYGTMVIIGASAPLASPNPAGAYLLALNASDGSLIWSAPLDPDLNSISTASPIIYNGIAYVGVSSSEENLTNPAFRGSLVAISLANGQILWQTYFVPQGYSGAPVWSSTPVIDVARSQIYVTTGNNYLVPESVQACEQAAVGNPAAILACQAPDNYEDSIVALDLATGKVKWAHHCSADDAWIAPCFTQGTTCPDPMGPDLDFGAGANLFTATIGGVPTQLVGAGQKSGVYWAISPTTGASVWYTTVGPAGKLGGMEWGTASDNQRIYVAADNARQKTYTLQPSGVSWNGSSWAALDPATGKILWQVPDPGWSTVHPSRHAMALGPVTVANGVVYVPSMSGHMYALDAATGATLWSFQAPGSVNAGPAIVNGTLYWGTGYHHFPAQDPAGTASNVFYAFSLPPGPMTLACPANSGQVGAPYSSALVATGGVPPYTFSFAAGSPPPGLTLNSSTGAIGGMPTTAGNFTFTAQAVDSTGTQAGTATANCAIAIALEPESLTLGPLPGQVQQSQKVTLSAQLTPAPGTSATVVFYDGAAVLGFAPVATGAATFTTSLLSPGSHTFRAYFPGNANLSSASSNTQPLVVSALPSATFAADVAYTAGVSPHGLAVSDFNLDGWPDLVVANYDTASGSTDSVSIFSNRGDGTFSTARNYQADTGTTDVAVGDFNGDGAPDLVVLSATSQRLTVMQGNGDGTFLVGTQHFTAGSVPVRLAVADFNRDGKVDVAVVNKNSNNVSVLLGNGDFTFQRAVNYPVGTTPYAAAVGDFNLDGIPDLAVSNAGSNNVTILLGKGDGTFQPGVSYAAGTSPASLTIADFNGDGYPDVAVANTVSNNVSVLLGNGDGAFQAAVNYAAGGVPTGMAAADVNGDGNLDLVTTGHGSNQLIVLPGNGDGTFQAPIVYPVGAEPIALAAADFNKDGRTDIATANYGSNSVTLLLGSSGAASTTSTSSANPAAAQR